jgi:hypothetical protein
MTVSFHCIRIFVQKIAAATLPWAARSRRLMEQELSHGGIGLRRTYLESSSKCFRKVIIATPTTAAICFCGHEPALFCVYAAQPSLSRL